MEVQQRYSQMGFDSLDSCFGSSLWSELSLERNEEDDFVSGLAEKMAHSMLDDPEDNPASTYKRMQIFASDLLPEKEQEIIRAVYAVLSSRAESFCSFVEADNIFGPGRKHVYKHFATLYFVFVIDGCESELGNLDLIQVFVETLDRIFKNVCELDIVYNFNKVHTVLDEIIMGGQVVETNSAEIVKTVQDIFKLER